jgi:molybdate transport system substrate-binding protein
VGKGELPIGKIAPRLAVTQPEPPRPRQQGLVEKPIPFATNTLVLVIPRSNPAGIHTVEDLTKPGVKVVIGDPGVPAGSYTRTVLKNLGLSNAVLKNVVSQETDVRNVLTKVAVGEADAGFVSVTDAKTAKGKVAVIAIREAARPHVVYEIAVVRELEIQAGGLRVRHGPHPSTSTTRP